MPSSNLVYADGRDHVPGVVVNRLALGLIVASLAACGNVNTAADAGLTHDGAITTSDGPAGIDARHLLIDAPPGQSIDAAVGMTPDANVDAQMFHVTVAFTDTAPTMVHGDTSTELPVTFSGGQANSSVSWTASATMGFLDPASGMVTLGSNGTATMNLNYNAPDVSTNDVPATITISVPADDASAQHNVEILCVSGLRSRAPLGQLPPCPV